MPDYFKNLEETLAQTEGENLSSSKRLKFWINNHLRIIWSIIMMLILCILCLWVTFKASDNGPKQSIIQELVPSEADQLQSIEDNLKE